MRVSIQGQLDGVDDGIWIELVLQMGGSLEEGTTRIMQNRTAWMSSSTFSLDRAAGEKEGAGANDRQATEEGTIENRSSHVETFFR